MLNCRQLAQLASESLDRELSFRERFGMRLHLSMCRVCTRYLRQLLFLRRACAEIKQSRATSGTSLSAEARTRISDAVGRRGAGG